MGLAMLAAMLLVASCTGDAQSPKPPFVDKWHAMHSVRLERKLSRPTIDAYCGVMTSYMPSDTSAANTKATRAGKHDPSHRF